MKTYSNDEIKDIRKKKEKKSYIIRIIIMALLIVLEIIFILLLINKTQFKNDEIGLFGGKVYIINDNSMNPELNRDDIIILKGVNEGINEQDIITIFNHIFSKLGINSEEKKEHPILLSEPILNPRSNREKKNSSYFIR